jgi:hypothetical protein
MHDSYTAGIMLFVLSCIEEVQLAQPSIMCQILNYSMISYFLAVAMPSNALCGLKLNFVLTKYNGFPNYIMQAVRSVVI